MSFGRTPRVTATLCVALTTLIGTTSFGQSTRTRGKSSSPRIADRRERVSGVIVKCEDMLKSSATGAATDQAEKTQAARSATYRLTINTNAVWRDWARDQAQMLDLGSTKSDAKKGANSIATVGEPADQNSLVVVAVIAATTIETRFRAADDESTKGSKAPKSTRVGNAKGVGATAKPVKFRTEDLKPGIFVEVDFRHVADQNSASTITVIRPIGGPYTPAKSEETPNP